MENLKFGKVYNVVEGSFIGSVGVLCGGFGNGCFFIKISNGDRVMVTASQIEISDNQVIKPNIYAHLNDYQFALQQILNALSIFIKVDGKKLNVENYMPLSIPQILTVEKLYHIDNLINEGNTSYIINIKCDSIEKISESEITLNDITC